jgi:hypothetical protein
VQANSRFQPPYFYQAAAPALAGRLEEAQPLARRVLEIEPSFRISGFYEFGMVRAIADKVAEGARLLGGSPNSLTAYGNLRATQAVGNRCGAREWELSTLSGPMASLGFRGAFASRGYGTVEEKKANRFASAAGRAPRRLSLAAFAIQ